MAIAFESHVAKEHVLDAFSLALAEDRHPLNAGTVGARHDIDFALEQSGGAHGGLHGFNDDFVGVEAGGGGSGGKQNVSKVARVGAEAFPLQVLCGLDACAFQEDKTPAVKSHANADRAILTALRHDLHRRQKVTVAVVGLSEVDECRRIRRAFTFEEGYIQPILFKKTPVSSNVERYMFAFDDPIQLKLDLVRRVRLDDRCGEQREDENQREPKPTHHFFHNDSPFVQSAI